MNDMIQKLQSQGYDTSWYQPPENHDVRLSPEKCGYFTMYRLEADKAYTIESDGSKYLEYRTLKKAVTVPVWYCQACKVKFLDWVQAKSHRESKQS